MEKAERPKWALESLRLRVEQQGRAQYSARHQAWCILKISEQMIGYFDVRGDAFLVQLIQLCNFAFLLDSAKILKQLQLDHGLCLLRKPIGIGE